MSGTIGTSGSDNLNGGSGADTIDGGDGNDKISAGSGNDIIDGGAGSDTVNGGSGSDTLVYNLSENLTGAKDVYTGGSGTDTVLLELTQAQWLDTGVRAELQRYVTFLTTVKVSTQGEVSNGSGSDFVFTFANGTTLTVQMMEKLAISVQETSGGPYLPVDYLAALITGTATGSVVEAGGVNNDSAGAPTATGDLHADDLDGPDDVFQAVAPGAATTNGYGTYAVTASGVWTFTLDNANAAVQALNSTGANTTLTDSFVVLAADGSAKTVTVTINGSNDAAVITGSSTAELTESDAAQSTGGDLNATDVDSSADFVAQTSVAGSNGYGQFSIDATGAWTYTMDSAHDEFVGGQDYTDSITVATADGTMQVLTVTMHGTNDAAVITGSSTAELTESDAAQSTGGDLNATDVDSSAAFVEQTNVAGSNGYGKFSIDATGAWTYTMDSAHDEFVGGQDYTDSITVATADGTMQVLTVTMHGTNDAAVITGSSTAELTESDAAQSTGGDLNASDVDSPATFQPQTEVAGSNGYGKFSIDTAGTWTYTMDSAHDEFAGGLDYTDSITVATADGTMQVLTVTMHGTNDAPTGTAAAALTVGTEDVTYTVSEADLLAGFNDAEGDTLSVSSLSASNGSAVQNSDGSWTITPSANFNGAVTLTYNVTDGNGGNVGGTQSYSLAAVNDNPTGTATAALAGGTEDVAYTVSAADLLAGFSDVDGDLLSVSGLTASNGAVADNGDGTYTITPTANFNGSVSLGYNVVDGNGGSVAASQSYSLNAVNDAPVITSNGGGESAEIAVAENTSAVTTVSSSDVDGPSATYSIVGGADALKFTINAGTGALAFVAAPDFEAPSDDGGDNVYDVQVQVSDGAAVDTQDIAITVTDVVENSAPTIANQSFTLREHLINAGATGVDASPNLAVIAADADGDPLTYSLTSDNSGGAFALSAGGTLTVKDLSLLDYESAPGSDAGGSFYSVGVSVSDGSLTSSALVKVYVSNVSTATTGTNGGNALDGGNSGETLTGGGGQDVVFGDGGNDTLLGDNGGTPNQDTLYGGSGDDTLNGQERSDDLYGGTGADTFVFNTAIGTSPANIDTIRDFEANGIDKILLDDDIFAALGPVGANTTINAGNFRVSAGGNAADNNDYILYDTATGNLFYDADGNGSGAKVQFATLTLTGVIGTVDNTDFLVGP